MINKQFRLPLALASLLLGLAGLAYWDDWQTKKDEDLKKLQGQILTLKQDEVIGIDYHRYDSETKLTHDIKLQRTDQGEWSLESPIKVKGDSHSIDNLLRQVLEYQSEQRIPDKLSQLADYGLAQPSTKIKLVAKDKTYTLLLGGKTPVGYSMYAMIEGRDEIIVGSQHLLTAAAKTLHDFRDKSLVTAQESDFSSISVSRVASMFSATRSADGTWKDESVKMSIDQVAMAEFISDLRGQNVQSFIDQPSDADQETFAKARMDKKITLTFKDKIAGERSMIIVGGDEATFVAFDPSIQIFKLAKEAYAKFDRDPMFFYDKTLADINVSTTERFTLQGQSFTKEKGRWLSDSGESSDAFNGKVSALFTSLSMAKADAVKPYDAQVVTPLGEPLFYLSVLMKDDKGVETSTDLKVWRDPSNSESFYVVNQQKAETMFMVSKSIITEFEGVVANFPSKSAAESKPQGSSNESTAVKNTQG